MLKKWKQLSRTVKFTNPWWSYIYDEVELPNGKKGEYHIVQHASGSAVIIPLLNNGKILLQKTYRYVHDDVFVEFPMGGLDSDEPLDGARRELIEETGFDGDLEYAGKFMPSNSVFTDVTQVFIASNLRESNDFTKDEGEEFERVEMSVEDFEEAIRRGEITDGYTLSSWCVARRRVLEIINV